MFLRSKLCLVMARSLGWLLMDITSRAVPQAAIWSSAFWNERLRDAPLKLVQRGIIHLLLHRQRGAPKSPCLPATTGLQGETLSTIAHRAALCVLSQRGPLRSRYLPIWKTFSNENNRRTAAVRRNAASLASIPFYYRKISRGNFSWGRRDVQGGRCIICAKRRKNL